MRALMQSFIVCPVHHGCSSLHSQRSPLCAARAAPVSTARVLHHPSLHAPQPSLHAPHCMRLTACTTPHCMRLTACAPPHCMHHPSLHAPQPWLHCSACATPCTAQDSRFVQSMLAHPFEFPGRRHCQAKLSSCVPSYHSRSSACALTLPCAPPCALMPSQPPPGYRRSPCARTPWRACPHSWPSQARACAFRRKKSARHRSQPEP